MTGNQIVLAAVTVSELRHGALVAGWADARRAPLEESIVCWVNRYPAVSARPLAFISQEGPSGAGWSTAAGSLGNAP